jgi:hypothetical protein
MTKHRFSRGTSPLTLLAAVANGALLAHARAPDKQAFRPPDDQPKFLGRYVLVSCSVLGFVPLNETMESDLLYGVRPQTVHRESMVAHALLRPFTPCARHKHAFATRQRLDKTPLTPLGKFCRPPAARRALV